MFSNPTFWALVGLVLFFALIAYLKVPQKIMAMLDSHADMVRRELDEAQRLREEAQDVLASFKRKLQEADHEAEEILAEAKRAADQLVKEAQDKAAFQLSQREAQATARIKQAEDDAVAEMRALVVDVAVDSVKSLLAEDVKGTLSGKLVKEGIADVSRTI